MDLSGVKKTDVGVAAYLLAAIIFFIVPIPSILLDVMLALNISIALIVLMNVLFVREVLDMSFFPTLLLYFSQRIFDTFDFKYWFTGKCCRNVWSIRGWW